MPLVIVDFEHSPHGTLMAHVALEQCSRLQLQWVQPDFRLPGALEGLDEVCAVAMPLLVQGASSLDRFTQRLREAFLGFAARQVPVFIPQPTRRRNLLDDAAIAVSAREATPSSRQHIGASGACVQYAARHVCSHHHPCTTEPTPWPTLST